MNSVDENINYSLVCGLYADTLAGGFGRSRASRCKAAAPRQTQSALSKRNHGWRGPQDASKRFSARSQLFVVPWPPWEA